MVDKVLDQDLKTGTFRPVYLLYGEEEFLKQSYKRRFREALVGDNTMNFNQFSGKGVSVKEIVSLADTMPFFAEHRMILVENSGLFKGESGADDLIRYLPKMPDTTVLFFVESEVDSRRKFFKTVKELGRAVEIRRQTEEELIRWIAAYFARNGLRVRQSAARELLERTGVDMFNIRSEMDKLVSYCAGKDGVELADVAAVTTVTVDAQIYRLVDSISLGRTRDAMKLYRDLLASKIQPMYILSAITREFSQILSYREMTAEHVDRARMARSLGVPPFVLKKLGSAARQYTDEELRRKVRFCLDMQQDVKSGKMTDRVAAELVIAGGT